MTRNESTQSLKRVVLLFAGIFLVVLGAALWPIPGPFGLPVGMLGTVMVLRNSLTARKLYVRYKKRWPILFRIPEKIIRRRRKVSAEI